MAHAVCHTSKLLGTYNPSKLVNLVAPEDMDNGGLLTYTALAEGEMEAFTGVKPTGSETIDQVALVVAPELMKDEHLKDLHDFYIEAGQIVRGYILNVGDEFELSVEGFDAAPTVGGAVKAAAAYKLSTSGSGTTIGKCIATVTRNGETFYVIHVFG